MPIEYKIDALERTLRALAEKLNMEIISCTHRCHTEYGSGMWQDGSPCSYCNGLGWSLGNKDEARE